MSCPDEFTAEVRSALAHLHDPAYLEGHPLATRLGFVIEAPDATRGNLLRRALLLGIESLDPGPGAALGSSAARPFHILRGRYIRGERLEEVAERLGIGRRQAFRELNRAVRALAQILWVSAVAAPDKSEAPAGPSTARMQSEVERLAGTGWQESDLCELLTGIVEHVQRLAAPRGRTVRLVTEAERLSVHGSRVMLRQAILNLLSHAVRQHQGAELVIRLRRSKGNALLQFSYAPGEQAPDALQPGQPLALATQLLESLGIAWSHEPGPLGLTTVELPIPLAREWTVLIIDDNQGLIRLFQRYLEGGPYRTHAAGTVPEALATVPVLQPDIILLDVMMPERDGWEVLQTLRESEAGRQAYIIICSIVNDPELAAALGADGFLHKPVDQASLLQALQRARHED